MFRPVWNARKLSEHLFVHLFGTSRKMQRSDKLTSDEAHLFRSLLGQLNWVVRESRPDIAFDTCELSTLLKEATIDDALRANKIVQRLKKTHVRVVIPSLVEVSHLTIECFSDASFGNLSNGGSQGGYIIFVADHSGRRCPIAWQSRKVRRVVKSTLAAETLALLDAAEAGVYVSHLLQGALRESSMAPIVNCFVDNKSLVDSLKSTTAVEDKSLRINIAVLRDMLQRGDLNDVVWVRTAHQLANALTKRGASPSALLQAVSSHQWE